MSDQSIFDESMRTDVIEQPFIKREIAYVQDNSSGVYNGQIVIESSQLSNSGKFQSWGESYVAIPYVVAFKSGQDMLPAAPCLTNNYISMKSGWWQIIHSMSVDYNGVNVVQLTPYLNIWASYKAVTSWSASDQLKWGATTNFFKDSVDSITWSAAVATGGQGVINNRIQVSALTDFVGGAAATIANQAGAMWNDGLRSRCLNTNYFRPSSVIAAGTGGNFIASANVGVVGVSNLDTNPQTVASPTTASTFYYSYMCVIRLKDVCDFFDKLPLIKGGYVKLTINYNAGSFQLTTSNAANATYTITLPTLTAGQTIPYMFLSSAANNPNSAIGTTAAQTIQVASNVAAVQPSGGTLSSNNIFTTCRLYVPLYTMNGVYEEQYLSANPVKEVVYQDLYQYTVSNTPASGNFNALITNGISSPKQLVIVPFINGSVAGSFSNLVGLTSLTSPFSAGPAQTDPNLALGNFNVQVSGINLFAQNMYYGWEEFLNELSKINAINGGNTTGLTSGLLSQHEYERAYRYVVCDLSRAYRFDDTVTKSILVSGQNLSDRPIDMYCFVSYERRIKLSPATGAIVRDEL